MQLQILKILQQRIVHGNQFIFFLSCVPSLVELEKTGGEHHVDLRKQLFLSFDVACLVPDI